MFKRGMTFVMLVALFALLLTPNVSLAKQEKKLVKNLPVSGVLADGGAFKGKLTITEFGYDELRGLTVSGVLKGTATMADGSVVEDIKQTFEDVPLHMTQDTSMALSNDFQAAATCDILFLDLGPLFLDVLGLQVDLSQIVLDIDAVSGAGNLLGNLLCGVVGLLDPLTGLVQFLENLGQLLDLINQINDLLG